MYCISTKSLLKTYGSINAVDRIDLDIKSGQVFGFLGPNGAGKSTAIKLFTTLIRPTNGTLVVLGIDATKKPLDIRRKIGVVLQQPSYEPTLSVEKSLDKYGMMWDVDKNTRIVMIPCSCPCGCNSASNEEICPDCKNGDCLDARE